MINKELVTDYFECKEITTSLSINSLFSYTKTGYVRLVKDWTKRSYLLELSKTNETKGGPLFYLNVH
jgi:hypothetical protein